MSPWFQRATTLASQAPKTKSPRGAAYLRTSSRASSFKSSVQVNLHRELPRECWLREGLAQIRTVIVIQERAQPPDGVTRQSLRETEQHVPIQRTKDDRGRVQCSS